jgi:cytochrome c-type biogenesis protein CcmE
VDLTPRVADPVGPSPRPDNRRKYLSIGLLVLVVALGGLVVTKFLTNSLDYYCNVDEVGHKSGCEEGRRLRIQGTVDEGSVQTANGITTFALTFNHVTVPVVYDSGQPGGLFQECIPVVVHGVMMQDGTFHGDDVEVKHGNDYEAKHPDRLNQARSESPACSQQP